MTDLDFDAAYKVEGCDGFAWRIKDYAKIYEWDYQELLTIPDMENVIAVMIGDDREFTFGVDEITVIDEDSFCHCCGQIGCSHGR